MRLNVEHCGELTHPADASLGDPLSGKPERG
jgi:hypothetical protein